MPTWMYIRIMRAIVSTGRVYNKLLPQEEKKITQQTLFEQSTYCSLAFANHIDWTVSVAQTPSSLEPKVRRYIWQGVYYV